MSEDVKPDSPSVDNLVPGMAGLKGIAGTIANLTAVALAFLLLWHLVYTELPRTRQEFHEELRSERIMFGSEMKIQREHDQKQTDRLLLAITEAQKSVSDVQRSVVENGTVISGNQRVIAEMVVELKKLEKKNGQPP